jgi:adenine phosphoribosyltransferase
MTTSGPSKAAGRHGVEEALRAAIRDVPDFPTRGILFKDVTPVLADPHLFLATTRAMAEPFAGLGVTHVAGVESRGFIFGAPVAQHLASAFVPVRKKGKLPARTVAVEYALEYGVATLELHADAFHQGAKVLLVDDVLATGGTAAAACALVERIGGTVVGCSFLVALSFLPGEKAMSGRRTHSLVIY